MLHMDVRWAVETEAEHILVLFEEGIYCINLLDGTMQKEECSFRGKPFSVCRYKDKLLFGDYGLNPNHLPVNVYCRESTCHWKVLYTFAAGTVRHIHNIITSGNRIYILTGMKTQKAGSGIQMTNLQLLIRIFWEISSTAAARCFQLQIICSL